MIKEYNLRIWYVVYGIMYQFQIVIFLSEKYIKEKRNQPILNILKYLI